MQGVDILYYYSDVETQLLFFSVVVVFHLTIKNLLGGEKG